MASQSIPNSKDYRIAVSDNLTITGGACSIGGFVNFLAQPASNDNDNFIAQADAGNDVGFLLRYEDSGGTKRITVVRDQNGVSANQLNYNVTLVTGQWYHILFTYDGTDTMQLFLNGDLVSTATGIGNGNGNNGLSSVFIVGDNYALTNPITANVKYIVVYNGVITAGMAQQIAQSRPAGDDPNLRLLWMVNEGSGTLASDHSPNGYHGTIMTAGWIENDPPTTYK